MQTYAGRGFEIDLDEGWRFYPDPEGDDLLYFQHQSIDAGLACHGMIFDASGRDLDQLSQGFLETYVTSLGRAVGLEGQPQAPKLQSIDLLPSDAGREFLIAGFTVSRGHFRAWVVVRHYLFFAMRMESLSLPETQLAGLFHDVRNHVFLGQLVDPAATN